MASLGVMLAQIQVILNEQLTNDQITTMLNLSDSEEIEAYPWARLKIETQLNTFAALDFPSLTVTQGSPTVTSNAATFPAVTSQYRLRISGQTFAPIGVITNSAASATLTLADPYPAASSAIATGTLFPMFYSAPSFQEIIGIRQNRPLTRVTHEWINDRDPARQQSSSPARYWAPAGRDGVDNAQFELWATETTANAYPVYGLRGHVDMVNNTDQPAIPSSVIVAKTISKCADVLFTLSGDNKWMALSQTWYGRYGVELEKAYASDREQFGTIYQIRDKYDSGAQSDQAFPGLDRIGSNDFPWG